MQPKRREMAIPLFEQCFSISDGVMVQVTAETMKKIRTAIKDMQDLVVAPDPEAEVASIATSKLKLVWGSSDDPSSRYV